MGDLEALHMRLRIYQGFRDWTAVSDAPGFEGLLIKADERADITKLTWHPKGNLVPGEL